MEFLDALKQDNEVIGRHIYQQLDQIYAEHVLPVHPSFEHDHKILTDYLRKPGRGIGGSIVLRSSRLFEEKETEPETLATAAATEVLNAYLLIIDDWLDKSDFRKNQPSVHKAYSELFTTQDESVAAGQAVQLGMTALYLADILVLNEDFPTQRSVMKNMHEGALHVTTGNILEAKIAHQKAAQTTENVLSVYANKTGYYSFQTPLTSGLLLAGAETETIAKFSEFAQLMGLAFQLQDDIMGLFGNPEQTGKPNTDDMREGLYTYVIDTAKKQLSTGKYRELMGLHGKDNISSIEAERYRQILCEAGIDKKIEVLAKRYLSNARLALQNLWEPDWNPAVYDYLSSMVHFLDQKKYT